MKFIIEQRNHGCNHCILHHNIEMYSKYNEGNSFVEGRVIRALKSKI